MTWKDPPVKCPVCRTMTTSYTTNTFSSGTNTVDCPRCGQFITTVIGEHLFRGNQPTSRKIAAASGWLRHHLGFLLQNKNDVETLLVAKIPSIAERAALLLEQINIVYPDLGKSFDFTYDDPQWLGASYSSEPSEIGFLSNRFLLSEKKFIESQIRDEANNHVGLPSISITPSGYAFLENRRLGVGIGEIGFCAMWFNSQTLPLWTMGIEPAIKDAGYIPKRIDDVQHNNKIDDEILSSIRNSKFVVADFTGQRGGVYFEAGFAAGLGIPVIWTVRNDQIDDLHFDTRQYNHIRWNQEELDNARQLITNRIVATIGRGTYGKQELP